MKYQITRIVEMEYRITIEADSMDEAHEDADSRPYNEWDEGVSEIQHESIVRLTPCTDCHTSMI